MHHLYTGRTPFGTGVWLGALLTFWAVSVFAQVSDAQRCVWSCLYGPGNGNAASSAYEACVAERCVGEQAPASDPTQIWQQGFANGGRYAGIDVPGHQGVLGIYYFCQPGQPRFFRMVGFEARAAPVHFDVDGTIYRLPVQRSVQGFVIAVVPRTDPLIGALQRGRSLRIMTEAFEPIATLSLSGAGRALGHVVSGC